MKRASTLAGFYCTVGVACIGLTGAWDAVEAQLLRRENVTLSTGVVYYRSAALQNACPDAAGLSVGFDFQTTGRWHAGGGMRMFLAGRLVCGGVGVIVQHQGQWLDEEAGLQLWGMPSLEVHAGRTLTNDDLELALDAAAKVTYGLYGPDDELGALVPWVGGRLTLDGIFRRLGVGFELGRHRAPVSWMDADDVVVRKFGRWEPLGQLTLRFRPWVDDADGGG